MTPDMLPADWRKVLADEFQKPYFPKLQEFVNKERAEKTIYPPEEDVFNAFRFTPYKEVRVLLLGQDPYHGKGQAQGLAFSVRPGVRQPPSLKNMFRELQRRPRLRNPQSDGSLVPWAKQGMMLLNAVLTVRAGEANSHKNKGWEKFTDAVIEKVNEKDEHGGVRALGRLRPQENQTYR